MLNQKNRIPSFGPWFGRKIGDFFLDSMPVVGSILFLHPPNVSGMLQ